MPVRVRPPAPRGPGPFAGPGPLGVDGANLAPVGRRPVPATAAQPPSPRRGFESGQHVRRTQLCSVSAVSVRAAKTAHPLSPSSFPKRESHGGLPFRYFGVQIRITPAQQGGTGLLALAVPLKVVGRRRIPAKCPPDGAGCRAAAASASMNRARFIWRRTMFFSSLVL